MKINEIKQLRYQIKDKNYEIMRNSFKDKYMYVE